MAAFWYFRLTTLLLLLVVPAAATLITSPQGGNRFIADWVALPMREGGMGLFLAFACLWLWGLRQRRRHGLHQAVLASYGLVWLLPVIAGAGFLIWFVLQQGLGWKPQGKGGMLEIGKPIFLYSAVCCLAILGIFWLVRLAGGFQAQEPTAEEERAAAAGSPSE